MLRALLLLALVGGVLTVAGCGGSSSDEESSTPVEALAEIATIRTLLDQAVTQYESGDQEGAADAVGDIYLEHYEHVEGPLGDANHDLMEEIEKQLSTELRTAMQNGATASEVESLVAEINTELDRAQEALS